MSLFESMSRDLGLVKRVDIQEVRMNKLNFYEYQDDVINSLKSSILENGQMENAIAYMDELDENGEIDGCKYTLVGGHTRYLAISKLLEEGQGDGYINLSIIEKMENNTSAASQNTPHTMTRNDVFKRLKTNLKALNRTKEISLQCNCEDINELLDSLINDLEVIINYEN